MKRHMGRLTGFLVGLFLLIAGILFQDTGQINGVKEWLKVVSNAALLSGVLLTGIGLLVIISGEGLFDGIKYATSSIWADLRNVKKRYATYYDYMKREKKKSGASSLMIPGVFYLLLSVILTIAFYVS